MAPRNKDDELEAMQESDRRALESGNLPHSAKRRLHEIVESTSPVFASTFSTREFLSSQNSGVMPIGQVMGTAFMSLPKDKNALQQFVTQNQYSGGIRSSRFDIARLAPDRDYNRSTGYGGMPVSGEIADLTYSRMEARYLAIRRMEQEAKVLKADGVIGVRIQKRVHGWGGSRTLEFTVNGTAVRIAGAQADKPFTSLLSAQEFWQLWQAGYEPKGIALGVCTYTDCTDTTSLFQRTYNQEVTSYTQCFYEARKLAMDNFIADVRKHRAAGAVGVKIEYEFEDAESEVEVSEAVSMTYLHLITHFVIMGTAVQRRQGVQPMAPQKPLAIYDLRKSGKAEVNFADASEGLPDD